MKVLSDKDSKLFFDQIWGDQSSANPKESKVYLDGALTTTNLNNCSLGCSNNTSYSLTTNSIAIGDLSWISATPSYPSSCTLDFPNHNYITAGYATLDLDSFLKKKNNQIYPVKGTFPPCNIYINKETSDLKIEVALAGYEEGSVSTDYTDDVLTLKGEKRKRSEEEKDKFYKAYHGIKETDFEIEVYVPNSKYDVSKMSGKWNNGLLTIEIPFKQESRIKNKF
jgi:HSP20 family molecular chaperone IbpA